MAAYLGKQWTRTELSARVGHMRQIADVRALEHAEGKARGSRTLHVYTGSGLSFDVLADRALDIAHARYEGLSLAWASSSGEVHPAYYEPEGLGWLRSFPGGLMTTCGLDHFGAPSEDMGLSFGLHGRVGNIPAEQVAHRAFWDGDDYVLEVSGQVRQSRLFGENMVLSRRIWTRLGADALHVEDTVTNEGFDTQPHMILYHCNLGFPLLNENAELDINAADTVPRDDEAKKGVDTWMQFQPPTDGYAEQVFRHAVVPDDDGMASAQLRSPDAGLALTVRYSVDTLPHLFQWKQMGKGAYVLGIEPANSSGIHGRAAARELDDLPHLEPGAQRHYRLSFEIATL